MPKRILGSGWQFPITLDRRDTIAMAHHEEKIKQSIFIILGTAKGERVMRPEFGCDIHDRIFDVIDASTLTLMRTDVKEALVLWEPRIEVTSVTPVTEALSDGRIDIKVSYNIRYTNTAYNLVYPFYLETEGKEG
jgi:phage baseplate assembly protein W